MSDISIQHFQQKDMKIKRWQWCRWPLGDYIFGLGIVGFKMIIDDFSNVIEHLWLTSGLPSFKTKVTLMLVTVVENQICWWYFWDVGDRFKLLVTDLIHWKNHKKVANIMILPPTSQIGRHHKVNNDVTNITVTSFKLELSFCFRVEMVLNNLWNTKD